MMFSFAQRGPRAKLTKIFNAHPDNFDLFVAELRLSYDAASKFMDSNVNALTKAQQAAAVTFAESFGYDMETNRLVRPGLKQTPRPAPESDRSAFFMSLWGTPQREKPWHIRAGGPVTGESGHDYRVRLVQECQNRLPPTNELSRLAVAHLDSEAFTVFADSIIEATAANTFDPSSVPRGQLAERQLDDPYSGLKVKAFIGQESFIKEMSVPGKRVLRLVNPNTGKVLLGPSETYLTKSLN